jgi:hypothetical protein
MFTHCQPRAQEVVLTATKTRKRAKPLIIAALAAIVGFAGVGSSFAACGAYCEARQTRAVCHQAVTARGLAGSQRDAEFEQCKRSPTDYLLIEGFASPAREILD